VRPAITCWRRRSATNYGSAEGALRWCRQLITIRGNLLLN
jgi:hypothetical protein